LQTTLHLFIFAATSTHVIYTLSLHDALPISTEPAAVESATEPSAAGAASEATTAEPAEAGRATHGLAPGRASTIESAEGARATRSEEHTSELQSRGHLVCRLLLEKKNKINNK